MLIKLSLLCLCFVTLCEASLLSRFRPSFFMQAPAIAPVTVDTPSIDSNMVMKFFLMIVHGLTEVKVSMPVAFGFAAAGGVACGMVLPKIRSHRRSTDSFNDCISLLTGISPTTYDYQSFIVHHPSSIKYKSSRITSARPTQRGFV